MASGANLDETEVKKYIRSILTANPQVSTMSSVQRDFKDLIGMGIPFYKFKYNSMEHFLKSIPDICIVNGSGPFASVYPVVSGKTAHIDKMVTSQRVNVKGKRYSNPKRPKAMHMGPPGINFRSNRGGSNYAFSPNSSSNSSSNTLDGKFTKPSNNITAQQSNQTQKVVVDTTNSKPEQDKLSSMAVKSKLSGLIDQQIKIGNVSKPASTELAPLSKNNLEKWNNNNIPQNAPIEKPKITAEANEAAFTDSKKEKLNNLTNFEKVKENEEEDVSNVPPRVQANLKALIGQFEDGIWSSDLPRHYRKLYKKELLYMDYGYTSLIDMCISLKHIFHYIRPGRDDFKLYDKSKALPANVEKNYTIASFDTGKKVSQDRALPDLDFEDFEGRFPNDILRFGEEIPCQSLPQGTKVEDIFEVVVVEIYDPSKFWFNLGTSENAIVDDLMDDIQLFYNKPENAKLYAIPSGAVKEGLYCVQNIYGEYHRARIIGTYPDCEETVRVFYIDYGTVCRAPIKGLCFLHSNFAILPGQAIRGRLANIIPKVKGPWPRSTSERFRQLVNRRDTKIKISFINHTEDYACVFLADVTDSSNVVYINETLVKEEKALWDDQPQISPFVMSNLICKVQNLHLFPTFFELESGFAPSAGEMNELEKMLVPIEMCIPQYFMPDDKVLCNEDDDFESLESTFIDTVRNHRRFTPWSIVDSSLLTTAPEMDFDLFGDLKDELEQFVKNEELQQLQTAAQLRIKLDACDVESEASDVTDYLTGGTFDCDRAQLFRNDLELSENILKSLETYTLLDSGYSTSPDNIQNSDSNQATTGSVPKNTNRRDICGTSDDISLSTIAELTEADGDLSSTRSCSSQSFYLKNHTEMEDINIFDNPEAFEDKSGSSVEDSPFAEFLKKLESKIIKGLDLGGGGDGPANKNDSPNTNPFISDESNAFDLFASAQINDNNKTVIQDLTDSVSEISSNYPTNADNDDDTKVQVDLPFESSLEVTRKDFISSLSSGNPFKQFLDKDLSDIPTFSFKSDDKQGELNTGRKSKKSTGATPSLKEAEVTTSDSEGSDYKEFVPQKTKIETIAATRVESMSAPNEMIVTSSCREFKGNVPIENKAFRVMPNQWTLNNKVMPSCSNTGPGVHPAAIQGAPVGFQPSPYASWSHGNGFPPVQQQYPQWSDANSHFQSIRPYLGVHPIGYVAGRHVPRPPGFNGLPMTSSLTPSYPPQYRMTLYQHPPLYPGVQFSENARRPNFNNPVQSSSIQESLLFHEMSQPDFYDRYNAQMLNKK